MPQKAVIIGAGPAGLTAAYELLKRTDIVPVILEKSGDIGGISKTVNYKGNRIDIGGHRFFSKSDRVMEWWMNIMPVEHSEQESTTIHYHKKSREVKRQEANTPTDANLVMLVRQRISRIYFLRKFFSYPVQLSLDTLRKLGLIRTISILFSYLWARLAQRKPERSLEDFFINRFGRQLYLLFFKDYTEKVWGVSCKKISAEWGAQRIKGISIGKAIGHAIKSLKPNDKSKAGDIRQKGVETSLIERFLYPKFGPGQLWEEVARQVREMGGEINMNCEVRAIYTQDEKVTAVETFDKYKGEVVRQEGHYFFSTMPIKDLIANLDGDVPARVKDVAAGLQYRDFITVGVLLKRLTKADLKDTWIYIQEKDVKVGRIQLFNNWSPCMVKDPGNVWIGMEYFCNDWDAFWNQPDETIKQQAILELEQMGLAGLEDVLDVTVLRMEKTYPAYFGTYAEFDEVRSFTNRFENLFLVGRNGMHKYNNSDHSMLTAMVAVDNIVSGTTDKTNIWAINTEQEYHEEKTANKEPLTPTPPRRKRKENSRPALAPRGYGDSFKDFLRHSKWNNALLLLAGLAIIAQFVIFKYFYPYPNFIDGDSYVYLESAFYNLSINTYPVGYPNFLRLFSVFSTSDTALVALQYLLVEIAILYFLFTIFFLYNIRKRIQLILLIFFVINPVFLFLSNYISSDALFLSLSLSWFTTLLWIIHRSDFRLLFWHGILIFLAFTVRYNALYYPLLSCLAYFLSRQRLWVKIAGPLFAVVLIGAFVLHTGNQFKRLTGTWQFSPFTGWQLANNALSAYRYVDSAHRKPVPVKLHQLDESVRHYFDTSRDLSTHILETLLVNTAYMWDPRSPLQHYMKEHYASKKDTTKLRLWASAAPLYAEYGKFLIREYPYNFARYYLSLNTIKYFSPPVEFLELYNTGTNTVKPIAQLWFGYQSRTITGRLLSTKIAILNFLPIVTGALNVCFLFGLLGYYVLGGHKTNKELRKGSSLAATLWVVNFAFSVFASPIALRFQLFPLIIFISFAAVFVEFMIKLAGRGEDSIKNSPMQNLQLASQ